MIVTSTIRLLVISSILRSALTSHLNCYDFYANHYLSRSGIAIISNVQNVDSCLQKCTDAETLYGFICRSAMMENERNECVLSESNRHKRPHRFMRSMNFRIDYYERICGLEQEFDGKNYGEYTTSTAGLKVNLRSISNESRKDGTGMNHNTKQGMQPTHTDIIGRRSGIYQQGIPRPELEKESGPVTAETSTVLPLSPAHFVVGSITTASRTDTKSDTIGVPRRASINAQQTETRTERKEQSTIGNTNDPKTRLSDEAVKIIGEVSQSPVRSPAIRPGPVSQHFLVRRPSTPTITLNTTEMVLLVPSTSSESDEKLSVSEEYIDEDGSSKTMSQRTLKKLTISQPVIKRSEYINNPFQCFKQVLNGELANFVEKSITVGNVEDCLRRCLRSAIFICLSVNFNRLTMVCTLNGGSVYLNDGELKQSVRVDYYENICSPGLHILARGDDSNESRKERSSQSSEESETNESIIYNLTKLQECFSVRENAVMYELNGFVAENVKSLGECLLACGSSRSTQKTPCYSLNWFKQSKKCFIHATYNGITSLRYSPITDFYLNSCSESDFLGAIKTPQGSVDKFDYYDGIH